MNLQVQIEKPSKILRKLLVTVPAAEVQTHFDRQWSEIQKKAKFKGFRQGKVPINIVKQTYGADVKNDVLRDVIEASYWNAIEKEKLKPVGQPTIEAPGEHKHFHIEENQDFTFLASIEIFPEIEIKNYKGVSVKKEKIKITDKDVNETIENIRQSRAQLVPLASDKVSSHKISKTDFADIEFDGGVVQADGSVERLDSMKGTRLLEIGSGTFVEGFEDQIIGMKIGEEKTFRLTMPKDYHAEELKNKEVEFSVNVKEVKIKELPKLDDDFAKELNYESVKDMSEKTKEGLTKQKEQEAEDALRNGILEELVKKNAFDVPQALVQSQMQNDVQDMMRNLKQQGFGDDVIQEFLKGDNENVSKRAENKVKAGLILDYVSKTESIEATEADFDSEVKKMAEGMGMDESKVREFYGSKDQKTNMMYRIRENKTVEFLVENANIK